MHGLQAVADVRERAPDDYAHGVIEIRLAHLVFQVDWQDFLTYGHHLRSTKTVPPPPADDGVERAKKIDEV
jgi:hypothetical protein